MTYPDAAARDAVRRDLAGLAGPADATGCPASSATPDPQGGEWDGMPAELLESARGYDTDSAGGCG